MLFLVLIMKTRKTDTKRKPASHCTFVTSSTKQVIVMYEGHENLHSP